jgi:hypothetical protein
MENPLLSSLRAIPKTSSKSSLSEIIGIEKRDALKIKFENKTYRFKANTSKGKHAIERKWTPSIAS